MAAAACGMAIIAADGSWRATNPALCRLLGQTQQHLEGQAAHHRLFPDSARRIDEALHALIDGSTMRLGLEIDYPHPQGFTMRLDMDLDVLPAAADGHATVLLQVRDLTEVHRARHALEAVARQQEQLAYGISHDLRASLRGIEGFATQLERQSLDDQGRDHLSRIQVAAKQAGGLVDALVQLSRASTVAHAHATVDMTMLATWVLAELCDGAPHRNVQVFVQPDLTAQGDERQLRLMLQQLLHNAWKFSAASEPAEIRVEGRQQGGRLELSLRDNGCGFDMRYIDKLFQPFRRLHSADDGGGHGLGLAIAQTIARRHGGDIRAQSQPGAGSLFFVELPAGEQRNEA